MSAYTQERLRTRADQYPDDKSYDWYRDQLRAHADALDRIAALEECVRELIERIDLAGGLGEYKGGAPFAVKRARELVK